MNKANALSRKKIEDNLSVWDGITTADGSVGKTSLIDAALIGANDYITNQVTVLILSGVCALEKRTVGTFNALTGEITFTAMSDQIIAGVHYRLINIPTPAQVAAILGDVVDLMADVGDASGSTLGSLLAILGNPASSLSAQISAAALEATLTAIKGVGWTNETLIAIHTLIAAIPTTAM